MQSKYQSGMAALALAGAAAVSALPAAAQSAPPGHPAPAAQARPRVAGLGAPLAPARLAALRGGTDTVSNEARLSGVVSGNSAINVSTGANTVDGASFANASGIPIVIQNSGANVLIQNATIVNLQLK